VQPDVYIILMSFHCYVMFDLAFALIFLVVLTFEHLTLGLGLELLSLESEPAKQCSMILILFIQTLALYKSFTYLLTYFIHSRVVTTSNSKLYHVVVFIDCNMKRIHNTLRCKDLNILC